MASLDCSNCNARGIITKPTALNVNVPASVDNGMVLRVKGKGNEAVGGEPGDLILMIKVQESDTFKRDGFDIYTDKKISVTQAILGGPCEIETIRGPKKINVFPGTEHNQQVSIKNAGLPVLGGAKNSTKNQQNGDHIVTF